MIFPIVFKISYCSIRHIQHNIKFLIKCDRANVSTLLSTSNYLEFCDFFILFNLLAINKHLPAFSKQITLFFKETLRHHIAPIIQIPGYSSCNKSIAFSCKYFLQSNHLFKSIPHKTTFCGHSSKFCFQAFLIRIIADSQSRKQ